VAYLVLLYRDLGVSHLSIDHGVDFTMEWDAYNLNTFRFKHRIELDIVNSNNQFGVE
jgi:hypothetical protein